MEQVTTMSYRVIRRDYQKYNVAAGLPVDLYAHLISPVLTLLFVRAKVIPNVVTVLMMVSGVIGAVLFAIPQMGSKIAGLLFIHLWYVLDCSDGEVARINRQFSRFGKEIDFTAHIVCHPLFNLAFAYSLVSMGRFNSQAILFLAIVCISAELVLRNLMAFRGIFEMKMGTPAVEPKRISTFRKALIPVLGVISVYPNFALLFPIAYVVDSYLGTSIAFDYFCIFTAVACFFAARQSVQWVNTIARIS
jgi:phosphatidylglycerophosphate synthase